MAKKRRTRSTFSKVMSVMLCTALMVTTYTGFFTGFSAAASAIAELQPGEVGLNKSVVQQDRSAFVTVEARAAQFEEEITTTETVKQKLDVVIIIDTSGSMSGYSEGKSIMSSVKSAAKELARSVYALNPDNRVSLVSFAGDSYAYSPSSYSGVKYTSWSSSYPYYFTAAQQSTLNSRIDGLYADGGTNSEGGLLAAEKVLASTNDDRSKLVVFMTDGLPTGRYKDNGRYANSVATYDGSGSGIPNYQELSELLESADRIASEPNVQMATVFYSGGLEAYNSNTVYYKGCTSSNCGCNSASWDHGSTALVKSSYAQSAEQRLMSGFYKKSDLDSARYIVNDLLAQYCDAGIYMPENASAMLEAFKDIVTTYANKNFYAPASNAYYEDIIPDYLTVDESTVRASMGSAEVVKAQKVMVNGEYVTRDIVRWNIGTIPEQKQTLDYKVNVKDERDYGIMDVSMQGILRYDELEGYTKTPSPLVVQIDELILAPKGAEDYYGVAQNEVLEGNIVTNDAFLNNLRDTSGNADEAATLVNGYAAGLNGKQSPAGLSGVKPVVTSQPAWGTVTVNEDGTFSYVQNNNLFGDEPYALSAVSGANDSYNGISTGWEDTFKYVLATDGNPTAVKVVNEQPSGASAYSANDNSGFAELRYSGIDTIANDKINVLVFGDMTQVGSDSEGRTVVGGDLNVGGYFSVCQQDIYTDEYALLVGGKLNGGDGYGVCLNYMGNTQSGVSLAASGEQWIKDYVAEAQRAYTGLSEYYANMSANGTAVNQYGGIALTAQADHKAGTPHVFNVDGSNTFGEVKYIGDFGSDPIIINVSGKNVTMRDGSTEQVGSSDLAAKNLMKQVVFNFYEAETLNAGGISIEGTVLAPKATFTYERGHVNGAVIVNNLRGNGYSAQYNNGKSVFDGEPYYFTEKTGYDPDGGAPSAGTPVVTTTYSEICTPLNDYGVMTAGVYDAQEALKSEEITVHIRIKPDLSGLIASLTSDKDGSCVKAGDEITYVIETVNPRSVAAEDVVITDAVPAGTTLKEAVNAAVDGGSLSWTVDIPAGQTAKVEFTVTVNDDVTGSNNLADVAYVQYTTPGEEKPSTINTNTVTNAYISAVKSSDVPAEKILDAGDEITYTIAATNNGSADAYGVTVTDSLPDGLSFVSGENVSCEDGVVTAAVETIPAGEKVEVSFTCRVDDFKMGVKTYQNTAAVNGIETNSVENTAKRGSVTVSYVEQQTGSAVADSIVDYGRTGSQYGAYEPVSVENYRLVSTEGSVTGEYTDGNTDVIFYYERIPGAAVIRFVDTAGVQIAEPQTVSGMQGDALDAATGRQDKIGHYDYVSTDATADILTEAGTVVTHVYKLAVDTALPTVAAQSDPVDGSTVANGDEITYYITVVNNKYEAMNNVAVSANVPEGAVLVGTDGTADGNRVDWLVPYIESGETAQVSFTVRADNTANEPGCLAMTGHVTYTDREATAATELDTNTITHGLLTFEKYTSENARGYYGVGDAITYFIKVRNIGSAKAVAAVRDDAPQGTELCTGSGNVELALEPGAEQIVSFTAKIRSFDGYEAVVSNTAYVNGYPTNTTNDIVKQSGLTVRYENRDGETLASPAYYTGTPGDEHPSVAPVEIYGYTFAEQQGETDGKYADGADIEIVNIYEKTPAAATVLYLNKDTGTEVLPRETITGFVGDQLTDVLYREVENYLFIETDLSDGTSLKEDGVTVIHYYRFIKPDDTLPELVKTSVPENGTCVKSGDEITYTLTFNNTRIDPINELTITDVIPVGCELLGASEDAGYDGDRIVWNIGTIEAGQSVEVSFTVKAAENLSGSGNLGNVAKASYSNRDLEPENGVVSNKVGFPVIIAELDHYNSQPEAVLTHGDDITYVVTVTNVGSAEAVNVPVVSFIPEGVTFKSSADFNLNKDNTVSAVIASLDEGASAKLSFTVTIDQFADDVFAKDIANIAQVNGVSTNKVEDQPKTGAVTVNHIDYDGKTIKTETQNGLRVNTAYGSYSDLVTLGELADRRFVEVDNATCGKITEGRTVVNFVYDRIPATLTVRYVEDGTTPEVEIRNTEIIDGFWQGDAIPEEYTKGVDIEGYIYDGTDVPEALVFTSGNAVITNRYTRVLDTDAPTVVKTSVPESGTLVKAGDEIEYTITVTNVRATDELVGAVVSDPIPAGARYIEDSASDNGYFDEETGTVTWKLGDIPAGEAREVSFAVKVPAMTEKTYGLFGNTAACGYTDVQTEEDHTVASNAVSHAYIVSEKTCSVSADTVLTEGSRIVYTVAATNCGTAAASVLIVDEIPDGTVVETSHMPENAVYEDGSFICTAESVAPGETVEFTFEAVVAMGGEYAETITNTASVNGENTNTVTNIAKRGEVIVSYEYQAPDGHRTALEGGEKVSGAVGEAVVLSDMNSYENLRYADTEASSDYSVFAEGLVKVVHVFERIPVKANILYKDIDTGRELLAGKSFDLYAGDALEETYRENVEFYEYVGCDAPEDLTVGENGLTITHFFKEIPDVTELVRVKSSVPEENTAVVPGDTVEYTITVENPRREALTNITVTDTVPAGTTLADAGEAAVSGNELTWLIENLEPGESAAFTFTVTVNSEFDPEAANLSNKATVSYTNRTENEETVLSTNTVDHAVILAAKSVDMTEANSMADLTYTVTVTNAGSADAENVVITDALPEGCNATVLPEGAVCEDGTVMYSIAKLAAGETFELSFTVATDALADGEYRRVVTNTAQVNGADTNTVETVITQGEINISYVDTDGEQLRLTERLTGCVGEEISVEPAEIEGYVFKEAKGTVETFTEGSQEVTLIYEKQPETTVVKFVDNKTGGLLANTQTRQNVPKTEVKVEAEAEEEEVPTEETEEAPEYKVLPGYKYLYTENRDGDTVHHYEPADETYTVSGTVILNEDDKLEIAEEPGEYAVKGVFGIFVTLADDNGAEVETVVTDDNGDYEFRDVPVGDYSVSLEETEDYEAVEAVAEVSVTEDVRVDMNMFKTRVLGASDRVERASCGSPDEKLTGMVLAETEGIKVYSPVEVSNYEDAVYTRVLGDNDVPDTGDDDYKTVIAFIVAATSLFVLIIAGKRS